MSTPTESTTEPGSESTGRFARLPPPEDGMQTRRFEALVQLFVARMPEALR